jgi:hypothetical protein
MKKYFKDLKRKCIWETQKRKCILKDLKMKQTLVVDQFVLLLLLQTINLLSKNIFFKLFSFFTLTRHKCAKKCKR